ncbi:MAG: hypothetical protein OXC60_12855 [Litoreibacter sp.]|nr:hypothetical protein [Litoreibacter sp.]
MFGLFGKKPSPNLRPRIRHFDQLGPQAEDAMVHMIETNALPHGHKGLWAAPFLADLVFLLEDQDGFVSCEGLEASGQNGALALQAALERFAEAAYQTRMAPAEDNPAIFTLEVESDPYLTPLLLTMPQLFSKAAKGGALLITHPIETRIFACPAQLDGAEAMMLETLNREVGSAIRQSDYVFRLEAGGRLAPYLFVPAGGAAQRVEEV